jgi:hypothetical protein
VSLAILSFDSNRTGCSVWKPARHMAACPCVLHGYPKDLVLSGKYEISSLLCIFDSLVDSPVCSAKLCAGAVL